MLVKIEKLDNFGRGITYIDGKITFVYNALPYEEVDIEITKNNKKYFEARVLKYISKSFDRCSNDCPKSDLCGGCNLRHVDFDFENKFKEKKVRDIMMKFAGVNSDVINPICYSSMNNYRNKVILHGKNGKLGLYRSDSNDVVPIDECLILNNRINDIIKIVNRINKNIEEAIIKTSNDLEKCLVSIKGEVSDINELINVCDVLILNGKFLTKEKNIITSIGKKKYYQSCDSFFQVNTTLTELLYDKVYECLEKYNNSNVLDLYCGTGTIGIYVSDLCYNIVGVDYNKSNIDDANMNKKLNNVNNISFICDKVENRIDEFKNIDVVIVDPPRAGLDPKTIKYLISIAPEAIIYVSCDPVTLARDIKNLSDSFDAISITPFNMFSRTYHCESITVLERR